MTLQITNKLLTTIYRKPAGWINKFYRYYLGIPEIDN